MNILKYMLSRLLRPFGSSGVAPSPVPSGQPITGTCRQPAITGAINAMAITGTCRPTTITGAVS